MLSLDGIPRASRLLTGLKHNVGHLELAFEARLCMSMPKLPLTLLLCGGCRTLGGPALEPLSSRARNRSFFVSKEPPWGEYSAMVFGARCGAVQSCVTWPLR